MPWERRTRRLLAQGVAWLALVSLGSWFAGCSGPSVGDVVTLKALATLYMDERLFARAVELRRAEAKTDNPDWFTTSGKWGVLDRGSKVRILGAAPGGYKVIVESGTETVYGDPAKPTEKMTIREDPKLKDKIGWILAKDLETP